MAQAHEIRQGMQVLGSDGGSIGSVDNVEGERIRLQRDADPALPRYVPLGWIGRVDSHVHLDRPAAEVRESWAGAGTAASPASRPEAATDRPARGSKIVWIIGAILLLLVIVLGIRAFGYAASEPDYEKPGTLVDAPDA